MLFPLLFFFVSAFFLPLPLPLPSAYIPSAYRIFCKRCDGYFFYAVVFFRHFFGSTLSFFLALKRLSTFFFFVPFRLLAACPRLTLERVAFTLKKEQKKTRKNTWSDRMEPNYIAQNYVACNSFARLPFHYYCYHWYWHCEQRRH